MKDYIAIDIAKDTLEVRSDALKLSLPHTAEGITKLLKKIDLKTAHFICEATGGYERLLMDTLHQKALTVSLLNPALVRAFAKSDGLKAKTDPIDAQLLLNFAKAKAPRPTPPPSPLQAQLSELLDRRSHLTEQLAREKNRKQKAPASTLPSIKRMIAHIDGELQEIQKEIARLIRENSELRAKYQALTSIDGIGDVTALSVLAYLSEIATLGRNQTVALAGLAPYNRDSGKYEGKRHIQGGRAKVRKTLYMAALTATQRNEVIKDYYKRLSDSGKAHKCALVAVMRKLLLHMRSTLKNLENVQKPLAS